MFIHEILTEKVEIQVNAKTSDLMRIVFDVNDTHFSFTAHSTEDDPSMWFIEFEQLRSKEDFYRQLPPNSQFKVLMGLQECISELLKNNPNINSLVFNAKDSELSEMYDKLLRNRMLPGWSIVHKKDGWFKVSKNEKV